MPPDPVAVITDEHRASYARDGIVVVRGAFEQQWIDRLLAGFHAIASMPEAQLCALPGAFTDADPLLRQELDAIRSSSASARRAYTEQSEGFIRYKYLYWWVDAFRDFIHHSPAAAIVAEVIGSGTLRFFLDAIFMKEAGCDTRTYWHADQPAWPVSGQQVPTMWMPLLPVDARLSSLEFIPGSHRQQQDPAPWPNTFNAKALGKPGNRPQFFDWEQRRGDGSTPFVAFDLLPGDVVVLHPNMQHGGGANLHPTQPRIAYSTRWFGDDVRWDPRPECVNVPGKPLHDMVRGQPVREDQAFPLLYSRTSATNPMVSRNA